MSNGITDARGDLINQHEDAYGYGKWKTTGFLKSDTYTSDFSSAFVNAAMGFTKRKTIAAIEKVLQQLVRKAKGFAPVRSGALRSSLTYFIVEDQLWGGFGSDLPYARYVNDGTSRMEGRHFLEAALESVKMEQIFY